MRIRFKFIAMCSAISILFSAFAISSVCAEVSHFDNLIDKGDIETADDSFCYKHNGVVLQNFLGIDTQKAHSGTKSVKTKSTSSWSNLVRIKPLDNLMPGETYIVSFWYYTETAFENAQMTYIMRCKDGSTDAVSIEDWKSRQSLVIGQWTKFQMVFEATEAAAELNYVYPAVVGGSGYGQEAYVWFDDFNLRMIPDTKTKCISSEVTNAKPDSTEVRYVFDAEPDLYSAYEAVQLNGEPLDKKYISITVNKNNANYEMSVTLKGLAPLAEFDIELEALTDVYGKNVEASEFLKISLTTLPTVGVDACYCRTDDLTFAPLTALPADEISLVYNLKNNMDAPKDCYVVTALCTGNSISKILDITCENIPANSETGKKTVAIGKIPEKCYIRTFYWSSLTSDTVRVLNEMTEIK